MRNVWAWAPAVSEGRDGRSRITSLCNRQSLIVTSLYCSSDILILDSTCQFHSQGRSSPYLSILIPWHRKWLLWCLPVLKFCKTQSELNRIVMIMGCGTGPQDMSWRTLYYRLSLEQRNAAQWNGPNELNWHDKKAQSIHSHHNIAAYVHEKPVTLKRNPPAIHGPRDTGCVASEFEAWSQFVFWIYDVGMILNIDSKASHCYGLWERNEEITGGKQWHTYQHGYRVRFFGSMAEWAHTIHTCKNSTIKLKKKKIFIK